MKCARLVLVFLLISVAGHAAPDPSRCEAYQTELSVLDINVMHASGRLSETEKFLEAAQSHLDAISNAMAAILSGSKYSMMDSMVLIRYCKEAIRPVGTLNAAQALPCINSVLEKMLESKRSLVKLVEELRAEDRDLRRQLFRTRELQIAAGCAPAGAASALGDALPPRDASTLCAEKWAGLRAVRVRLEGICAEYDGAVKELAASEKNLDHYTAQATTVQAGDWHEMMLPSGVLACAGYFTQSVTPAKVAACYNEFIGGFLKDVRAQRKVVEALRDKDREARREAATIRDIAAEMKCPEPPPLNVPLLPELAPLQEPKLVGAPVMPPTLSQPGATSQGDVSAFIGRWTGTIKITAASDPSIIGTSETGTLELFAAGKGVGVKARLGVIGDPAAYQVKVSGDRLQIHYTGPSHTTAIPGIPATLDYTLDVTRKGGQLIGASYSTATSSYRGQTATVSFTQQMTLNR